ncbi:MAG: cupin domain-containing protein [Bacteroidota bacterium]|nr:cupin domain-containing protein [Bacteroidota bacterium]
MTNVKEFCASGVLESYVMGLASPDEIDEVEKMAVQYPEVQKSIDEIHDSLEEYAFKEAIVPDITVKSMLMATIDYTERLKNGEIPVKPPLLHENSQVKDYEKWLDRKDMILPVDFKDIYAKIIGYAHNAITALVWIKDFTPSEIHHKELEKFLIVEGTCVITVDNEAHKLVAGNFFSIPLHKYHDIKVTSQIPCKAILERRAA